MWASMAAVPIPSRRPMIRGLSHVSVRLSRATCARPPLRCLAVIYRAGRGHVGGVRGGEFAPTLVGQEVAQGHLLLLLFGSCGSSRQPPFHLSRATPSSSRLEVCAAVVR